jgi:mycothiol synthase
VIELRVPATDGDYATWAAVKTAVEPDEPVTADQLRATDAEKGRLLLLAALDGLDVGCGVAGLSNFGGRAFMAVRVLPAHRRRGVGGELVRALSEHGRALGRTGVNAFVDAADAESIGFAERRGLRQVDYQLQTVREVGDELAPVPPAGIELVALGARRDELLRELWPVARAAYAELPLPGAVTYPVETWLREEATVPDGSFAAYEGGELVGYAGLIEHADESTAEHGFTFVRPDRRGRGLGRALKQAQLHWAAGHGVGTLVYWTQRGNEGMQALNASLGYRRVGKVLTMQGPIPV